MPRQQEQLARRGIEPDAETRSMECTLTPAAYLDYRKRHGRSPQDLLCQAADAAVGFGAHKGDANMAQAMANLGKGTIADVWGHQGSRPALWRGRLYSALGNTLHCVDPETRTPHWKRTLPEGAERGELLDGTLTPPAIVNGKIFVGTLDGAVCCFSAWSGNLMWSVRIGEPVLFQPAVARGRVYAATQRGSVFCVETGDSSDDGWLMWGATPGHNGIAGMG
jgi:hypothetical protein